MSTSELKDEKLYREIEQLLAARPPAIGHTHIFIASERLYGRSVLTGSSSGSLQSIFKLLSFISTEDEDRGECDENFTAQMFKVGFLYAIANHLASSPRSEDRLLLNPLVLVADLLAKEYGFISPAGAKTFCDCVECQPFRQLLNQKNRK